MPNELMHLAQLECWSGNWPLASRYAEESVELAEQVGQSFGGPPAMRALIDAHLGNVERARARRAAPRRCARERRWPFRSTRALGFLQLSLGDAGGAELHLSRALEIAESFGIREPAVYRVHADLIEALIATGDLDRAEAVLNDSSSARRRPGSRGRSPPGRAAAGSCSQLAASSTPPNARSRARFASTSSCRCPSSARGRCSCSGSSSAGGTSGAARTSRSRQALAIFEQLGAPLWAREHSRELRPLGGRPTSSDALTPGEQRVAELAASGLTNRQVAAALFISPKTVESNLARAYRKLDIRSRAELGAHVAAHPPEQTWRGYRGKHPLRWLSVARTVVRCESTRSSRAGDALHGRVLLARCDRAATR